MKKVSKAGKTSQPPPVVHKEMIVPPDPQKWSRIPLESYPEIGKLEVMENPCDLRRDLHVFIGYVSEHKIKRTTRENYINKADARRLAKLMSADDAIEEIDDIGYSTWMDTVDQLACDLGFIHYDTKGIYAGYSSSEPSFPDNVIQFNKPTYTAFLQKSLAQQEKLIFDTLIDVKEKSELFERSMFGRLSRFSRWGSATGVIPTLDFKAIRIFLFKLLANYQSGIWYSVASLVQTLKAEEPYFLIPRFPHYENERDRKDGRYGNFHESTTQHGNEIQLHGDEPDIFERVEGRYIEQFLESIPLLAGYVDVAYTTEPYQWPHPMRNVLRAFHLHEHFIRFMRGELSEPKVTVQPNYEIHVESALYPANVLNKLAPITNFIRADRISVLKLDKRKVTAALAQDAKLDVVKLLTDLNGRALPQNIQTELEEWAGHSDNFILYDGFALFESAKESVPLADPFTVERIAPNLRIVNSSTALFTQLERAEELPLRITHLDKAFEKLSAGATTLFPTQAKTPKGEGSVSTSKAAKAKAKPITLLRKTLVTLYFPNQADLDAIHAALVNDRCPIEVDRANLTLSYTSQYEAQITASLKKLADSYLIKIEEIGNKA